MLSLMFHQCLEWLGVYAELLFAAALIIVGAYLIVRVKAGFFRFLGLCMLCIGIAIACYSFGRAGGLKDGGANVEAQWRAKNYEATIAELQKEAASKKLAADLSAQQATQLADQQNAMQSKVDEYATSVSQLQENLRTCRRASADDVMRLCAITGNRAAGCKHP